MIRFMMLLLLSVALVGCGTIETGNVGVRTTFGKVDSEEVTPGVYTSFLSSVTEFSAKEIEVALENLKPKAKDNLSLQELDISVYYSVNAGNVAELNVKYANQSTYDRDSGVWYPSYLLVERIARNVIYEEVSKYDSLVMHTKRDLIANAVKEALTAELENSDSGAFRITRVVVRALNTDSTIEDAIRKVVSNQKELESMAIQDEIAKKQAEIEITRARGIAEANRIINGSLTREYLQHEANLALMEFAKGGSNTVVVPANMGAAPLIQIPSNK